MLYLCYLYLFTHTGVQHDFHIRWWMCRLTVAWWVSHVEQELLTHPEYLSSLPVFSGVRVARYLVLWIVVCPFVLFLLTIVMSILLRFTASDYYFGIFKLFSMVLSGQYIRYCIDLSTHNTLNCTTHTHYLGQM